MIVNGKKYTLWGQFVEKQNEFIGGALEDFGDKVDQMLGARPVETKITGIKLEPNGGDSAQFIIEGEKFDCSFDVQHGGVIAGEDGWITFSGYLNHTFRIRKP